MRQTDPPSAATWILEHLTPGPRNEALAGDLLEEFRRGRSIGWYWRQALAAVLVRSFVEIVNNRFVMLFAALWSMLTPAWLLFIANLEQQSGLNHRFWQMDWPWSTLCDLGLLLAVNLIFIWAGILLFLIPHLWARRELRVRSLGRAVLAGLPILVCVWLFLALLPKIFLAGQTVNLSSVPPVSTYSLRDHAKVDIECVSPAQQWDVRYGDKVIVHFNNARNAITDTRNVALVVRLPFFLTVLCTLWGVSSRFDSRRGKTAA